MFTAYYFSWYKVT